VLQSLLEAGGTLAEWAARWGPYTILKDKLPRQPGSLESVYQTLITRLGAAGVDRRDGLRLEWPEQRKWLHLRPSGTEPIFRIIAEGTTAEDARELIGQARAALETRAA